MVCLQEDIGIDQAGATETYMSVSDSAMERGYTRAEGLTISYNRMLSSPKNQVVHPGGIAAIDPHTLTSTFGREVP